MYIVYSFVLLRCELSWFSWFKVPWFTQNPSIIRHQVITFIVASNTQSQTLLRCLPTSIITANG